MSVLFTIISKFIHCYNFGFHTLCFSKANTLFYKFEFCKVKSFKNNFNSIIPIWEMSSVAALRLALPDLSELALESDKTTLHRYIFI